MPDSEENLQRIILILRAADRKGPPQDIPEGARYITLSHTLAVKIANDLQEIINRGYV